MTAAFVERDDLAAIIAKDLVDSVARQREHAHQEWLQVVTLTRIYDYVEGKADRKNIIHGDRIIKGDPDHEINAAAQRAMAEWTRSGEKGTQSWRRFVRIVVEDAKALDDTVVFDNDPEGLS